MNRNESLVPLEFLSTALGSVVWVSVFGVEFYVFGCTRRHNATIVFLRGMGLSCILCIFRKNAALRRGSQFSLPMIGLKGEIRVARYLRGIVDGGFSRIFQNFTTLFGDRVFLKNIKAT